jgi:transposase
MERYIGIDVHAQSSTIVVMGASGRRLRTLVVETHGEALVQAINGIPGRLHICLEEGTQSAWLYEILSPCAEEVVVVSAAAKSGAKDDQRDAWALAEALRVNARLTRVYKGADHLTALRNALRGHCMLVQDVARTKNRLKAVFRSRGVLADDGVYNPEVRGRWLKQLSGSHRELAEYLGRELDELEPLRDEMAEWLLKEARTHPIVRKLKTVPGLGPIRTAAVVGVTMTPFRFRTARQYWSYCGLAVMTHSSSDWERVDGQWVRARVPQTVGLTRRRQPLLKAVFKGAAMTVITQMRDHPLHKKYEQMLAKGIKPNLAKLTLARQIAAIVLSMWKHQEAYDPEKHQSRSAA